MVPIDELEEMSGRRPSRVKLLAYSAVAIVLAGLTVLATRPAPERPGDRMLPDFSLPRLDSNGTFASADVEGSPVIVNFWASWCEPCREEMPLFEQAWLDHREDGLVVLGVNVQDQEPDARAFLRDLDLTFPTVRDADQTLARALGVFGLPQTFFVRTDGTLLGTSATGATAPARGGRVVLGAISRAQLNDAIEELLGP